MEWMMRRRKAKLTAALLIASMSFISLMVASVDWRSTATPEYVALGSSFASGPGLAPWSPGSPALCGRSASNYAHLVAERRHLSLVDVTCAGATTENVLHRRQYFQRPQIDAIGSATRLVTITIGGNDVSYLGDLAALSCGTFESHVLAFTGWCTPSRPVDAARSFKRLESGLLAISSEVHRRAPNARLLFVNYLTVLPAEGSCGRLDLRPADAARMRALARRLESSTRRIARRGGDPIVDIAALSRAHDVCSGDPWLNPRHPQWWLTAPLHPNAEGMRAVAEAVDRSLDRAAP